MGLYSKWAMPFGPDLPFNNANVEIVPRGNEITGETVSPVRKTARFKNRPGPAARMRLKAKEQIRSARW